MSLIGEILTYHTCFFIIVNGSQTMLQLKLLIITQKLEFIDITTLLCD